jgi:hypothetical protein
LLACFPGLLQGEQDYRSLHAVSLIALAAASDVACFAPLKRSYSHSIPALARSHIYYISKETFLLAFKAAYNLTFTEENACAGFRGARLVPFNLDAVLLKLDVRLRTPTPPQRDNVA